MKKLDIDQIATITDPKLFDPKKLKTGESLRAYAANRTEQHKLNLKDSIARRSDNHQWRTNHKRAAETRNNDNLSAAAQKKYLDAAYAQKIAQGNQQRFSKSIVTPWGKFASRRLAIDAGREQGVVNPSGRIDSGVKKQNSGFYYVDCDPRRDQE